MENNKLLTTPSKPKTKQSFASPHALKTKGDSIIKKPSCLEETENNPPAEDQSLALLLKQPQILLNIAYKIINRHHGLAYGTPDSPIYGENTRASMSRALTAMRLGESVDNIFCDVGSGTGAPSIHAACEFPALKASYGFEVMGSRWWISQTILRELLQTETTQSMATRVMLAHVSLSDLLDFGPCTHIFAFDTGFPKEAIQAFARACNASQHVQVLGSFQKLKTLEKAGFTDLHLVTKVKMTMSGSSEGKQLMVYERKRKSSTPQTTSSWDLTRIVPPCAFPPNVDHGESYAKGEAERLKGSESYARWVEDQVGFTRRSQRVVGVTTRSQARKSKSHPAVPTE